MLFKTYSAMTVFTKPSKQAQLNSAKSIKIHYGGINNSLYLKYWILERLFCVDGFLTPLICQKDRMTSAANETAAIQKHLIQKKTTATN